MTTIIKTKKTYLLGLMGALMLALPFAMPASANADDHLRVNLNLGAAPVYRPAPVVYEQAPVVYRQEPVYYRPAPRVVYIRRPYGHPYYYHMANRRGYWEHGRYVAWR